MPSQRNSERKYCHGIRGTDESGLRLLKLSLPQGFEKGTKKHEAKGSTKGNFRGWDQQLTTFELHIQLKQWSALSLRSWPLLLTDARIWRTKIVRTSRNRPKATE